MNVINTISGPLVGAVIGYFTNLIAVKMLFLPRHEIKIFNKTLPFTPGIIPKGKPRLARAIGNAVGENLFTGEDIKNIFLSEETKSKIADGIYKSIFDSEKTLKMQISDISGEEKYENLKEKLSEIICEKIADGAERIDFKKILEEKGVDAIKEALSSSMLSMFITENLILKYVTPVSEKISSFVKENAREYIYPIVKAEISSLEERKIKDLVNPDKEAVTNIIKNIYDKFVNDNIDSFLSQIKIGKTVEEKVNEMDPLEIEKLVLGVMQKELNAIVNLGAFIGFIIGIINIFI